MSYQFLTNFPIRQFHLYNEAAKITNEQLNKKAITVSKMSRDKTTDTSGSVWYECSFDELQIFHRQVEEQFNKPSEYNVDDKVIVFDADDWNKVGGDVGDNSCFYKPAVVVNTHKNLYEEWLADVVFEDGRRSNGHFQTGIKRR